ncbi:NAD(P)/FAD-dependent oxidoreductase [Agromyces cerinus]|uniref:3-phenylpropionate/trans-cinnamate dioxygenase ferredoxin reductase subunit n=1 Tax=Agromyces cerinus subsp. cerinus TaxID=232089 RepID=A0A1N6E1V5_9MICO|nr:FAD-dependent oxidoreductase [Agromyces cerinus]SIN76999.1 3-phenylpropionate/trans-cinnamate dioxygenase ferredoxin reductase subunit [Agromyces cerinus subsp. cerinus]
MTKAPRFVIVGGGLAGATAAKTLRDEGFSGGIHLIAAESHHPYIRPPLSKDYLAGTAERDSVFVETPEWYRRRDIDLQLGTSVTALDSGAQRVSLDSGGSIEYDALLLATGSTARRLTIPGAELHGVRTLRTLDDSEALHDELAGGGRRLVLIGSGWIGMEVAATARTLGNEVTILERDPVPLANALGDELGGMFAELHVEHGVELRTSVVVTEITGEQGRATGVRLDTGERFDADLVLVGVGAVPNLDLARNAGAAIGSGVLTDAALRTDLPNVYAAGDITEAYHPLAEMRLRSEHWANALHGGAAAARSMLGLAVTYDDIPYFYTDQYDLGMEYSGFGPLSRGAEIVYRGDPAAREFISFWVSGGRVVAGMNVNVWDVNEAVQGVIRRGNPVDPARLADERIPLEEL